MDLSSPIYIAEVISQCAAPATALDPSAALPIILVPVAATPVPTAGVCLRMRWRTAHLPRRRSRRLATTVASVPSHQGTESPVVLRRTTLAWALEPSVDLSSPVCIAVAILQCAVPAAAPDPSAALLVLLVLMAATLVPSAVVCCHLRIRWRRSFMTRRRRLPLDNWH